MIEQLRGALSTAQAIQAGIDAAGMGTPPLKPVSAAVAAHMKKIEVRKRQAEQLRLEAERENEAARGRWIAAMRERLELEYGLAITDADVGSWRVEKRGRGFEFIWYFRSGYVGPNEVLTLDEVEPGGKAWLWNAHSENDRCLGFDSLIAALTFAATGERLT